MLTAIEVLDTAVKVGLGALITAVAAYFGGRDKARLDRENSFHQELRTLLRQIAAEIAKADAYLEDYFHKVVAAPIDDAKLLLAQRARSLAECASTADHAYALAGLSGDAPLRKAVRMLMDASSNLLAEFGSLSSAESFDSKRYSELVNLFNEAREASLDALALAYAKTAA